MLSTDSACKHDFFITLPLDRMHFGNVSVSDLSFSISKGLHLILRFISISILYSIYGYSFQVLNSWCPAFSVLSSCSLDILFSPVEDIRFFHCI